MDISVVIPLLNEEESLPELNKWIHQVMKNHNFSFEIIYVDDGSTDQSWKVIQGLAKESSAVKALSFRRNYGKSAALNEGFALTQGKVVITMDADLQDSPDEIPELYDLIQKQDFDLISGWKKERHDPLSKTIPTKLFNAVTRLLTGIQLHDFNCGLKAYKADLVKSIEVYGEMHRYIPVIAKSAGFHKIGEKVVQHQARKYGSSKFGLNRFINGFLDLLTIVFVTIFRKKPMHFFGSIGLIFFLIGFSVAGALVFQKLYYATFLQQSTRAVTDQPLFFLAIATAIIGTQLFMSGFVAELINRNATGQNTYKKKAFVGISSEQKDHLEGLN